MKIAKSAITWLTALAVVISAGAPLVARQFADEDISREIISWGTRALAWIGITILILRRVIELPKGRPIVTPVGVIPLDPPVEPPPPDPEPFEPIPEIEEPEPVEEPELEPVFEEPVVEPEPVVEAEPEPVPEPPPPPQPKPRTRSKQKAKHHPSNPKPVTDG